jgi:hypothetical protein
MSRAGYEADRYRDRRPRVGLGAGEVVRPARGKPEQFTFEGAAGETVYGYVVKPVDFDPRRSTRSRS